LNSILLQVGFMQARAGMCWPSFLNQQRHAALKHSSAGV